MSIAQFEIRIRVSIDSLVKLLSPLPITHPHLCIPHYNTIPSPSLQTLCISVPRTESFLLNRKMLNYFLDFKYSGENFKSGSIQRLSPFFIKLFIIFNSK